MMSWRLLLWVAIFSGTTHPALAEQKACSFDRFPAQPFAGKPAALEKTEFTRAFRTRLQEGLAERPSFAGSLALVQWGCGSDCMAGGLIDQRTGKAEELPFTLFDGPDKEAPLLLYRPDSRLLIARGSFSEASDKLEARCYVWTGAHLRQADACQCAPISLKSLGLDRIADEVQACATASKDERAYSACLLTKSRADIDELKQYAERLGARWTMNLSGGDAEVVSRFLHTAAVMYKLPAAASDSLFEAQLDDRMEGTMWMVYQRENRRQEPGLFDRIKPAAVRPLKPGPADGPLIR